MKFIIILFVLIFYRVIGHSQPGQWVWIGGDTVLNYIGNFGVQGIPDSNNLPPTLYEPAEFADRYGNFWLFGGKSNFNLTVKARNDLWKYDPQTGEWTWMKGRNLTNDFGIYGIQGVPASTNLPPALTYGVQSWVDTTGNFWIHGGSASVGSSADLWKYNPVTNEWTWMKGTGVMNTNPVYGTKGIASVANMPGSREETSVTWTDRNNNLWFFGGGSNGQSLNNDLWKYNIANNTWTWMSGSNGANGLGHWGIQGVEDSANVPSGRNTYAHWVDTAGNFWMFGGIGLDSNGSIGTLNDMWRYNLLTNKWTWMSGSPAILNTVGSFGNKCIFSTANIPSTSFENRSVWTDAKGDFWMFGGSIFSSTDFTNELWKYCVATNQWIWVSGDTTINTSGHYGTKGIGNVLNVPPGKMGALGWYNNYNLYLFGGFRNNTSNPETTNDLWKFEIDTTCYPCNSVLPNPISLFHASNNLICEGSCVNLLNQSLHATSFVWSFPGGNPSSDTSANPQNICYFTTGNYDIILIASNSAGADTFIISNAVHVFPPVQFSPISQHGDTLFSTPGYISYQWYMDTTAIPGANSYYYVGSQSGDYSIQVTDSNGCSASATMIGVLLSNTGNINEGNNFTIVSSNNEVYLNCYLSKQIIAKAQLTDELGKQLFLSKFNLNSGQNTIKLNDKKLSAGIYFVIIEINERKISRKIFIN